MCQLEAPLAEKHSAEIIGEGFWFMTSCLYNSLPSTILSCNERKWQGNRQLWLSYYKVIQNVANKAINSWSRTRIWTWGQWSSLGFLAHSFAILWEQIQCLQQNCNIWWRELKWAKRQTKFSIISFLYNRSDALVREKRGRVFQTWIYGWYRFRNNDWHWMHMRRFLMMYEFS